MKNQEWAQWAREKIDERREQARLREELERAEAEARRRAGQNTFER